MAAMNILLIAAAIYFVVFGVPELDQLANMAFVAYLWAVAIKIIGRKTSPQSHELPPQYRGLLR